MTTYRAHADDSSGGPNGGQVSIGSTGVYWALGTPNAPSGGDYGTDHVVHGLSVSVENPTAVLEIVYGRVELSSRLSISGGQYYRGNRKAANIPGLGIVDATFHEILGRYFLSGGQPLQLDFPEPVESLSDAESTTDDAFAVWVKRVDSSDEVGYHLDVDFEVRYGY